MFGKLRFIANEVQLLKVFWFNIEILSKLIVVKLVQLLNAEKLISFKLLFNVTVVRFF